MSLVDRKAIGFMPVNFVFWHSVENIYQLYEFFGGIFSVFMYRAISSPKGGTLTSFSICVPFILFSCLIALAKTSSTVLNRDGDSEYPCIVADLRETLCVCSI